MKKFVKLSLAAAVATAGLTTANAGSLEEAIKGVQISGTAVYRYNEKTNTTLTGGNSDTANYSKVAVDLTSPINDTLTFGATVETATDVNGFTTTARNIDNQSTDTADENLQLSALNFTYTGFANTTIIAGKQAVDTPWTVAADSDGLTHNGTGIFAVNTSTPVTLIGAYYNQTNFGDTLGKTGASIYVVGAKASVEGFNLEAMYADQEDAFDSYTVAASTSFTTNDVKVGLSARHTDLSKDSDRTDNSVTYGKITAKLGNFSGFVAYGVGGDDSTTVAFDQSAVTTMEGYNTYITGADAEYTMIGADAQVLPTVNVALNYFENDAASTSTLTTNGNANDMTELYTQITWSPSKNFYTYVRYSFDLEIDGEEYDAGRIQAEYKF